MVFLSYIVADHQLLGVFSWQAFLKGQVLINHTDRFLKENPAIFKNDISSNGIILEYKIVLSINVVKFQGENEKYNYLPT